MLSLLSDIPKSRTKAKSKNVGQVLSNEVKGIWMLKYLIIKAETRMQNLASESIKMSCEWDSCLIR